MNNSTIAWKTRAQLDDFMVKMFHGFPKPQNKFIRDMVYGIQATGDTIITDIARAVAPEDKHRNVENRLSRNLQAEGLHEKIRDAIQADAVRFIDRNTLVIYDPTDVCKPHSYKMEKLSLVRDASRSSKENVVTTRGYHGCMAVACKSGARKTVPLDLKIWSSLAEGHKGENEEVLDVMRAVDRATDGRGIRVYDRGISHDRRSPRSGALAWVGQARLLRLPARQREEVHHAHEPEGPLELEGNEVERMARGPVRHALQGRREV